MVAPQTGSEPLIVLDTETTGLDHKNEKMIEIAAVKLVNGEIVEEFNTLINPQQPIRHSSFKIHHISEEMVADAPVIEDVLPQFLEFVGDYTYVAHNVIFDYSFINEASKALLGKRFTNPRVDTLDMYRSVFPEEPSHGLSSLLARFGFDPTVDHRALSDAKGLAKVYPKLRMLYEEKLAWQFSQLDNIHYLVERYIRLQRATQIMQSEMADLKDVFKLHFAEGGRPVQATTGETMVMNAKRNYEFDDAVVYHILEEAGLLKKAYKLNPKALEKLLHDKKHPVLTPEQISRLEEARHTVTEGRSITFVKPTAPEEEVSEEAAGEPPAAVTAE